MQSRGLPVFPPPTPYPRESLLAGSRRCEAVESFNCVLRSIIASGERVLRSSHYALPGEAILLSPENEILLCESMLNSNSFKQVLSVQNFIFIFKGLDLM